ncbi:hypothetical protein [uncultured Algoriphagus sp.]|uniref:hypothetical protein n=1 Tax=uncultured Algoriphagus sp. TaxID=417365 RepID=UPI0030EDA3DF|tara:strand:+ start:1861 stop:2169 length:309 start_codon:yes stop_codon:yes gene_type:complete
MENEELLRLKDKHLGVFTSNYDNLATQRSYNKDKLSRLQENLTMWSEFLKSVNQLSNGFVDELNSSEYISFSTKDKEEINELYREEIKKLVLENNRRFVLGE